MKPNLERITGDRDWVAQAILERAPQRVDQRFLDSLDPSASLVLGRYGIRLATFALRERSTELVRRSLLATGIAECLQPDDPRDVMVGLALPWFVTQQLGGSPATLFNMVAVALPEGTVSKLLKDFGRRSDITLADFAWEAVTAPDGPDFCSLY